MLKAAGSDWMDDKALRLSAAMAYYAVFSIAPLLVIAIGIAGLALGQNAVQGQLDDQLAQYIGPHAAEGVQSMVKSASKPAQGWMATTLGFATLLLGASGVFGQLKDALNTIWEVRPRTGGGLKAFVKERLLSFGMVLVIGFLLLTSLLLSTVIAGFSGYMERVMTLPPFVWGAVTFLVSFGIVTTLFALIFKVLPDVKLQWRDVWLGAAVTALLFELGKLGLSYYLGKEGAQSTYGAATAIVLLLLWVYYTSCILFFGAEFTQVYVREQGRMAVPMPNAEPVGGEERALQGMSEGCAPLSACTNGPAALMPQKEKLPKPQAQPLHVIPLPEPKPSQPLGSLLAVTGLAMTVGLLSRGWAERQRRPRTRVKEGLLGMGREAGVALASALDRAKHSVERKVR